MKNKKQKICCNNTKVTHGTRPAVALLVVLFIIMAITVLTLGYLTRSDTELAAGENVKLKTQLDYLAQSGLEHARGLLLYPEGVDTSAFGYWRGDSGQQLSSGDDYYNVSVAQVDLVNHRITSTAYRMEGGTRIAQSIIDANVPIPYRGTVDIAVSGQIYVRNSGRIDAVTGTAVVSTNSTSDDRVTVRDNGVIDGSVFVSPDGDPDRVIRLLGSGEITGVRFVLAEDVNIPVLTEPSLGLSTGNFTRGLGTDTTISTDLHCNGFTINRNAIVRIQGNITILAENNVSIREGAQLIINSPGSTLTFYAKRRFTVTHGARVNVNTADPSLLTINHMGTGTNGITIDYVGQVYATVVSPGSQLLLLRDAQLYGTFTGEDLVIRNRGQVHVVHYRW